MNMDWKKKFITDGTWDIQMLQDRVSTEMVQHTIDNISPILMEVDNDKTWWMGETSGRFTVKSTWEIIRKKQEQSKIYNYVWPKGLPVKISFFMWRV